MNHRFFPAPRFHVPLALMFIILIINNSLSFSDDEWFFSCNNPCGYFDGFEFPSLWRYNETESCDFSLPLKLKCEGHRTTIQILGAEYELLGISMRDKIFVIAKMGFSKKFCSPNHNNISPLHDPQSLIYGVISQSYDCGHSQISNRGICPGTKFGYKQFGDKTADDNCVVSAIVPIPVARLDDLRIRAEFKYEPKVDAGICRNCSVSGGVCGYDMSLSIKRYATAKVQLLGLTSVPTLQWLRIHHHYLVWLEWISPVASFANKKKSTKTMPLIIGVSIGGAAFIGMILGCCIFYCLRLKKKRPIESKSKDLSMSVPLPNEDMPASSLSSFQTIHSYPFSKSEIERGSSYYGVQVFSYAELEKATSNFNRSRELGDGGFGTVYYGKLQDGREVAVKRLHENSCKRVEQFMNEVDIIAHLQHQNLVKLYGCTSKHSQGLLLVYEYIPNGTVADHLHGRRAKSGLLSWPVRLRIAIETANALSYLHHSDIIHRDVKTSNILLDNNFTVKVADFGLSRLFPTNVTHVSTAPQGTLGYVDPEYYHCYQLTNKSDVYSFGVVLIELISSLRAVDTNRQRHDINLSNMAVSRIQSRALDELVDPALGFDKDYQVRRMITSVAELAFGCLQQERDMRPSMEEVLEVLRGIESDKSSPQTAEVVDIREDNIGVSKNTPPSLSPDSVTGQKWVSSSTATNSM